MMSQSNHVYTFPFVIVLFAAPPLAEPKLASARLDGRNSRHSQNPIFAGRVLDRVTQLALTGVTDAPGAENMKGRLWVALVFILMNGFDRL